MKRYLSLLLALSLLVVMTACGGNASTTEASSGEASDQTSASMPVEEPEAASIPAEEASDFVSAEEPEETDFVYELPLTQEPVTLTFFSLGAPPFVLPYLGEDQSYSTAESTLYLAEQTGVKIDYQEVDMFSFSEQLSLMAASGDFTDLILSVDSSYSGGCAKALDDGVILDLTEYVEGSMPLYNQALDEKGARREVCNDEGQYLAIHTINNEPLIDSGGIIRKDYLDELGLEVPTTYEELYTAAKAMVSRFDCSYAMYLDAKINPGFGLSAGMDLPTFDAGSPGTGFYQIDGKVQYAYTTDAMRDYIAMLAGWYREGLISPDFFTADVSGQREVYASGDCVVCWDGADAITNFDNNEELQAAGFTAVGMPHMRKSPDQTLHFTPALQGMLGTDAVCISTACQQVDIAVKFLDYMFSDAGQLLCNYGMEGKSYDLDENGVPQWSDAMYATGAQTFLQASATYVLNSIPSLKDVHANDSMTYDEAAYAAIDLWSENYDGSYAYPTSLTLTTEENETYIALISDVETYISEYFLKCITGGEDIASSWGGYVETVNGMGAGTLVELQQAAYDRYQTR